MSLPKLPFHCKHLFYHLTYGSPELSFKVSDISACYCFFNPSATFMCTKLKGAPPKGNVSYMKDNWHFMLEGVDFNEQMMGPYSNGDRGHPCLVPLCISRGRK